MGCGCSNLRDGKAIADLVRSKGKDMYPPQVKHEITCECGETFTLETVIMSCPKCEMTYAVTPCSSDDQNNIKPAGLGY